MIKRPEPPNAGYKVLERIVDNLGELAKEGQISAEDYLNYINGLTIGKDLGMFRKAKIHLKK
jgi:hypothetical protein